MTDDILHEVERFLAPILSKCMHSRIGMSAAFADPSTKQIDEMDANLFWTHYRANHPANNLAMARDSVMIDDRLSSKKLWGCSQIYTRPLVRDLRI